MSAASMGDVVKVIGKPELGTGVVRFHGKVKNNPATWIGLEFSRPLGKNNGSSNGVVYFSCPDNHGLFVKVRLAPLVEKRAKSIHQFSLHRKTLCKWLREPQSPTL